MPILLLKYSWPALVAMTLNALYSVVDRVFIGQFCGVDSMAAITLSMPVVAFFSAFGVFIGAGHAALLSIKLGENNLEACEKLLGQLVAFKLLVFAVLSPLVYFNLDTVLSWCGADKVSQQSYEYARQYLALVVFSHIFSHLAFGLSAMQRAEGNAVKSMKSLVVGFAANIILDPIFIFCFDMGVRGAAWATNISMFLSALWAVRYYMNGSMLVKFKPAFVRIHPDLVFKPFSIGLAPFVQQLMGSVIIISLQLAFAYWIKDERLLTRQVASLGVFHAALILILMPILGCQQGLQPIIGYNWGARNFKRVKSALVTGFAVTTVLSFVAWLIQVVPPFPHFLSKMFISAEDIETVSLATHDLVLSNCMIWCVSLNIVATTYFQSIGKGFVALALSTLRQGVVMLPLIWFLPFFFDNKASAIWAALPISDVVCCAATFIPLYFHWRFLKLIKSR